MGTSNPLTPARLAELRKAAENALTFRQVYDDGTEAALAPMAADPALVLALLDQLAAAQLALVDVAAAALAAHKVMTGDAAPESLTAKSAIRAGLANHDPAIRTALKAQP